MIHVAEAGEAKGRVVVQLCSGEANAIALDAAIWLARAYQSEIESIYVENQQLIELARFPFAREISLSGRTVRSISCADIEQEFRFASAAFRQKIEARARAADVPFRQSVVRDEPLQALAQACSEHGPWNAVALAEPFTAPGCPSLHLLFETVAGTTGLMLVGPRACRTRGPIVLALEDTDRLPAMIAAAERLAASYLAGDQVVPIAVCVIAHDADGLAEMEGPLRLVIADRPNVEIAGMHIARGSQAAMTEALRRLMPGLVIGRFGAVLVPRDGDLRALAEGLECPLLLVR